MTDSLDSFFSSNSDVKPNGGGRKCLCCLNDKLAADIVAYLDKLADGKTEVPLTFFHERYVVPTYERPRHINSLYKHVRHCLRRNRNTGKSLSGAEA